MHAIFAAPPIFLTAGFIMSRIVAANVATLQCSWIIVTSNLTAYLLCRLCYRAPPPKLWPEVFRHGRCARLTGAKLT